MSEKPMPAWAVFAVLGATLATPFCSGTGGGRPALQELGSDQVEHDIPPPSAFDTFPAPTKN